MTVQERCKELLPVIQAAADGGTIQIRTACGSWEDIDWLPAFGSEPNRYRIKPAPQYRPYTPAEALKHEGRKFELTASKRLGGGGKYEVIAVSKEGVWTPGDESVNEFSFLLEKCVWADDGTPCGVLVSE